jgi:peptidoglycan/xylan/chitin deacetylase (PgdA/CDA1 family)
MKSQLKRLAIEFARRSGCCRLLLDSDWRQQRLLILCYHGTSIDDEHQWDPQLYISAGHLRRRLELIREARCHVLPLEEAIRRLYAGDLPPRAVAVTYDDGAYDFCARAYPLLNEFDIPSTVYLTTYYVTHRVPVFDPMCSYLLWKARSGSLAWPDVLGDRIIELSQPAGRVAARAAVFAFVAARQLGGSEKADLLAQLAEHLGVDYSQLLERRILQLMTTEEASALARQGVDIQLHTHRHGVSLDKDVFAREIRENREIVERLRGKPALHFCYPSGAYRAEFLEWLREWRLASATTCDPGLVTRQTEPLQMPRLVDTSGKSEAEFVAWLSGAAALLPTRSYADVPVRML